jgi:hypothetical protein
MSHMSQDCLCTSIHTRKRCDPFGRVTLRFSGRVCSHFLLQILGEVAVGGQDVLRCSILFVSPFFGGKEEESRGKATKAWSRSMLGRGW